jgi:hypothetical protein
MADQPVQTPSLTGALLVHSPCANGDQFINNGRTWISVKNGDASSHTVTVTSILNCSQGVNHPGTLVVAAGEERIMGPFDPLRFNDVTNRVSLAYTALTSMTIAVFST